MKYLRALIVFLIVGFGIWLYFSSKKQNPTPDNSYEQLHKKYIDTLKYYAEYILRADSAVNNATAMAIQAGEAANRSQAELDQARDRVKELLTLLDAADKETPDSTWVQVSPDYKWGCDSLRRANLSLNTLVMQYEQDNQAHVDAMNYEIQIRDSAIKQERAFGAQFRQQLAYCIGALGDKEKSAKKRPQLYAGMAAWGNSIMPLGGGEINLGLKTPNDQFYEIKGAYLRTWWIGIGTKFLIHIK